MREPQTDAGRALLAFLSVRLRSVALMRNVADYVRDIEAQAAEKALGREDELYHAKADKP